MTTFSRFSCDSEAVFIFRMTHSSQYQEEFVQALLDYVAAALRVSAVDPDYCQEAVQIVDARNHLFRQIGEHRTDEEQGIYALRDLCVLDDEHMLLKPDAGRCRSVARDCGLYR